MLRYVTSVSIRKLSYRKRNFDGLLRRYQQNNSRLYSTYTGTGDCLISLTSGGHADDQHKWNTECHDGEAIIAIRDSGSDYQGFGCTF